MKDGTHYFLTPEFQELRSQAVSESNARRITDGTHPFVDPEIKEKKQQALAKSHKKRIADGTHHLLGPESNRKRMEDGTHNFITNHPMKDPKVLKKRRMNRMKKELEQQKEAGQLNIFDTKDK